MSLRILAFSYLASASVFVVAAAAITHPQKARQMTREAAAAAQALDANVWQPALKLARQQDVALLDRLDRMPVARLTLAPPGPDDLRTLARAHVTAPPPQLVRDAPLNDDHLNDPDYAASATVTILPDLSPESAPVPPEPLLLKPETPLAMKAPRFDIAREQKLPLPPPVTPAPGNRGAAVAARLRDSLTPEMLQNFDLFLYVSKADRGPLAQRLYVFQKTPSGALDLLYDWAASTGRERDEITPRGRSTFTATPAGFYELDPDRLYRRYHSWSWDQDMPHALFFNWEREGIQTGLAIHAAVDDDIARLGSRASAGCVHLSPENAALLFELVHRYRGSVPRFAYNGRTDTMSNHGDFAHSGNGSLRMTDGYRVLVDIEDYGGSGAVARN